VNLHHRWCWTLCSNSSTPIHNKEKIEYAHGVCVPAGSCCPYFPTHRLWIVIHPWVVIMTLHVQHVRYMACIMCHNITHQLLWHDYSAVWDFWEVV
jgi:hypothetical protein